MDRETAFSAAGIVASLASLGALAAPYLLVPDPGTGLGIYYRAGPTGAGAVAFLTAVEVVALGAASRGRDDPATAAGVAVVVGGAAALLAVGWATAVPRELVLSFPAPWMGWHRFAVVGLMAMLPVAAAGYAAEAL